jgi:DNA-binding HxlR family transcriptional regulator
VLALALHSSYAFQAMIAHTKPQMNLCPRFEAATELLGKRWSALLVHVLLKGPARFSEIAEAVPALSEPMLSGRLKELEVEGIVARLVDAGPPVKVHYSLTDKGRALSGVLAEIGRWAERWVSVNGAAPAPKTLKVTPLKARPAKHKPGSRKRAS